MTARLVFNCHHGFTLIEIMLVVVIISVMSAIVGPKLLGRANKARVMATKQQIQEIHVALTDFEITVGRLPANSEGLEALVRRPSGMSETEWPEKFMMRVPRDSWGERFTYRVPSEHRLHFDLISMGPDRSLGTDDDITNWGDIPEEDR